MIHLQVHTHTDNTGEVSVTAEQSGASVMWEHATNIRQACVHCFLPVASVLGSAWSESRESLCRTEISHSSCL